jgi:catechol-2,3-dioxygenase
MNGFDSHVAVEVESMEDLKAVESNLNSIEWGSFIIDHEFVTSLYIFDPNGIQLEFTCRASDHDEIMEEDAAKAHQEIKKWTEKTREMKVEKFGEEALNPK